jgi:hypothetical protein
METDLEKIVDEIVALTGAAGPAMMREDAPVLSAGAMGNNGDFYLVGLIGGKDVGKSALVNALAGQVLSQSSSHGTGTDRAIAYLHESQVEKVRQLLERVAPGRFETVPHQIDELRRLVLVDLPDIDSHYAEHVEITRRMLRHMLFPLWVQSVEKYADQKPQQLLADVATGNAPENFIFCLNKADQVVAREGEAAAHELRQDYAGRIARTLKMDDGPDVRLISAIHPDQYDLPELRRVLGRQKSIGQVDASRDLASKRQAQSLMQWIEQQDLPGRLARLDHLQEEAEQLLADRLTGPLLDEVLPQLLNDPAWQAALADGVMEQRIARWPVVNFVQLILGPLTALGRQMAGKSAATVPQTEALVESALAGGSTSLSRRIQGAFAHLQQTTPVVSELYGHHKLWEPMAADEAAAELRGRLVAALQEQRENVQRRLNRSWGVAGMIGRWFLTVGVAIWFIFRPIFQPLLHGERFTAVSLGWALLSLLQADFLLITLLFLILYFLILWLILRRGTQRRVNRLLKRWGGLKQHDPAMNLSVQTVQWGDELLAPITQRQQRMREVVERVEKGFKARGSGFSKAVPES